jgi:hypothetical protein
MVLTYAMELSGPALAGGLALAGLGPAFSGSDFSEKSCSRSFSIWAEIGMKNRRFRDK